MYIDRKVKLVLVSCTLAVLKAKEVSFLNYRTINIKKLDTFINVYIKRNLKYSKYLNT